MMALDEAIRHAEEVAIDQDLCCSECADEHRQLAEWLKDYKRLLEQDTVSKDIYTKTDIAAILTELQLEIGYEAWTTEYPDGSHETIVDIESVSKIIQQKIDKYKTKTESQEYEPIKSEENTSDDCVSRAELLKAMDSCPCHDIFRLDDKQIEDYVPYVKYDDIVNCVKGMPPVNVTHGTCKHCSHRDPEDKKCDCGHDIMWQLPRPDDWYCKDFEKRGSED